MPEIPFLEGGVWPTLLLATLLGGLVRGFTGFGFAMIFMPIASSVVPPPLALPLIFLIDCPFALVLGARATRHADVRSVLTLLVAAACFLPVGLWLLTTLDAQVMRWIISGLILGALAMLASGWRYHGKPGMHLTLGVGSFSGLFNGMASLGGMPLALFWLSSQTRKPVEIRADMQSYFGFSTVVSMSILALKGLLSLKALLIACLLMPLYGCGLIIGTRGFHVASETTFRRIAYAVIFLAAVLSLPILDGVIR